MVPKAARATTTPSPSRVPRQAVGDSRASVAHGRVAANAALLAHAARAQARLPVEGRSGPCPIGLLPVDFRGAHERAHSPFLPGTERTLRRHRCGPDTADQRCGLLSYASQQDRQYREVRQCQAGCVRSDHGAGLGLALRTARGTWLRFPQIGTPRAKYRKPMGLFVIFITNFSFDTLLRPPLVT